MTNYLNATEMCVRLKLLESLAQWAYEHKLYELEEKCDEVRFYYLNLMVSQKRRNQNHLWSRLTQILNGHIPDNYDDWFPRYKSVLPI